jgi:methyl-accepting chemotaxis protein
MAFRLTHRIAALGLIGLLGMFILTGILMMGQAEQARFQLVETQARELAEKQTALALDFLEARRTEKDFLLRASETYVVRHATITARIDAELQVLAGKAATFGDSAAPAIISEIRMGFKAYETYFKALAQARISLGLTENTGLEGTLRKSVHAIEESLKTHDQPHLSVIMLMMRRHEKDFMLRRTPSYGETMKVRAQEFRTVLAQSTVPAAARTVILANLDHYQNDFFAWMKTAIELVQEQGNVSSAYAELEKPIAALKQRITQSVEGAERAYAEVQERTTHTMRIAMAIVASIAAFAAWFIGRSISNPLLAMTGAMGELASGRLDVVLPGLQRRDEIGDMAGAVEKFKIHLGEKARLDAEASIAAERRREIEARDLSRRIADNFEAAVGDVINKVDSLSLHLASAAGQMTLTAKATLEATADASDTTKAAAMNAQTVAQASDEMASTVTEISERLTETMQIVQGAVLQVQRADTSAAILKAAVNKIGDVVALISGIANQTNLLALNATIEAARAGESGRGFAVVAAEVKVLANQTADATKSITSQIHAIENTTSDSVEALSDIGNTINHLAKLSADIAAAVAQQDAATREVARTIQHTAMTAESIRANITVVHRGATDTGAAVDQVHSATRILLAENTRLKTEVSQFLSTVRAA